MITVRLPVGSIYNHKSIFLGRLIDVFSQDKIMKFLILCLLIFFVKAQLGQARSMTIEFIGDVNFHANDQFADTRFNGLSGITYDEELELFHIISDDRARFNHARLYSAKLSLFPDPDIEPRRVVFLKNREGEFFSRGSVDFEGIVVLESSNLLLSSEGNRHKAIPPALMELTREGTFVRLWPLPSQYLPDDEGNSGIRHNLGPESLAITPDKQFIFTANEQALLQDGSKVDIDRDSLVRLVKYDKQANVVAQYGYRIDALPNPNGRTSLSGSRGLVELIALDENNLLALERSYVKTLKRNFSHLYHLDLSRATDVSHLQSLTDSSQSVIFAEKKLLLDFDEIIPLLHEKYRSLDNIEGMSFGPDIKDGSRLLVFVSDGNFNRSQRTQFLLFTFNDEP